jgi:hypothetical protein
MTLDRLIALEKAAMVPAAAAREATWRALEASVASGVAAPVDVPLPPAASSLGTVIAGAVVIALGAVALWPSEAPVPASPPDAAIEVLAPTPPIVEPTGEPPRTIEDPPAHRPKKKRIAPPNPPPAPSLTEQLELLRAGQRLLASSDFAGALAKVAEHRRRFPESPLDQERSALEVLAACGAKRPEARTLMDRFFAAWPRSPQADRIRLSCSAD